MADNQRRWLPWRGAGAALLLITMVGSLGMVAAEPAPESLRLLRRVPVPATGSVPTDVRWASDSSFYISWFEDGVAEIGLGGKKRRELVPDHKTLQRRFYNHLHLAASSGFLSVAGPGQGVIWRTLKVRGDGSFGLQSRTLRPVTDIDLHGNRLLLLGHAYSEPEKRLSQSGIAWLGTISEEGMEELRPVLTSEEIPARGLLSCQVPTVGGARFFADGSFVVAPGFQDGIHLFNAQGQRLRSWTHEQIGVDIHKTCSKMNLKESSLLGNDADYIQRWLNRHHLIDDVLPLPEGPGVLVRSWGRDGRAQWVLKVLRPDGITTYRVPVTSRRPFDRLRGDVRGDRILLLLSSSAKAWSQAPADIASEVLLMELPHS